MRRCVLFYFYFFTGLKLDNKESFHGSEINLHTLITLITFLKEKWKGLQNEHPMAQYSASSKFHYFFFQKMKFYVFNFTSLDIKLEFGESIIVFSFEKIILQP